MKDEQHPCAAESGIERLERRRGELRGRLVFSRLGAWCAGRVT
jgi:hypothetical protein